MPWTPADAEKHTHLATTPERREFWARVANSILKDTGDDAMAIRVANKDLRHRVEDSERKKKRWI